MYLLGYDIGSSSIKAALVDAQSGQAVRVVQYPETEMEIKAEQAGWAEQEPESWWRHVCQATQNLLAQTQVKAGQVKGIGISYQMHGLVIVDENQNVLRPSIIWCDSRAVDIGKEAFQSIGQERCLSRLLNSPGNFTASKLKWVKENEPDIYRKIHKMMLPGDYIAMKLTGRIRTTPSGLSEGILWDFEKNGVADMVLEAYGLEASFIPEIVPTSGEQGELTEEAARACGLVPGIPVTYRAGDQPNNALSLGVLAPGEIAATGGTSGVVYGVMDKPVYDPLSRVNSFVHVNHSEGAKRIGVLLCINGSGIQYSWLKHQVAPDQTSYEDMEKMAASVPIGSEGLRILPFGNGAERMLSDASPGAQINNLQFNRHQRAHLYRAGLEGIAFSFAYGIQVMKEMGLDLHLMRVGNDNLFQSNVFSSTVANLLQCKIEVVKTTGAVGAARAAGVETGFFGSLKEAVRQSEVLKTYEPGNQTLYQKAYELWVRDLEKVIIN